TIDTCYNDLAFRSELSIHYICKILDMVIEDNILKKNHCLSLPTRRAIEYMHKSYKQNITLTSIAKHLGLNKCYFCNIFKKETNMTFSQFLNNLRIEKSKVLLKNTELSLLDIAVEVGFNNQSYFTMAFKKLNDDKTPLEYRRNLYLT
ncbi:MAG: AraC family transcriptional regulator, partial [Clostridiaceae bacterium]|nr:AraC family transcriptional regulator [Clostridiaceae bacterium]